MIDLGVGLGATSLTLGSSQLIIGSLPAKRFDWLDYAAELYSSHLAALGWILIAVWLLTTAFVCLARFVWAASIGEYLFGVRLVTAQGDCPSWSIQILHSAGSATGLLLLGQGYFWAAVDLNRQGLANYVSGTILIIEETG